LSLPGCGIGKRPLDAYLWSERNGCGTDLIDDAGPLTDQALADAVQGLQVKLVGGLGRNELHGRALYRLGDRLRIAEVVLLSFR
jgi:hypothetical protein